MTFRDRELRRRYVSSIMQERVADSMAIHRWTFQESTRMKIEIDINAYWILRLPVDLYLINHLVQEPNFEKKREELFIP